MNQFKIVILLPLFLLAACVQTRDPQVISTQSQGDADLNCTQLAIEYTANTEIASLKIEKNNKDDKRDFLIGALVWPGLADFKNADGIEGNALLNRNIYLLGLHENLKCDNAKLPAQPDRYT